MVKSTDYSIKDKLLINKFTNQLKGRNIIFYFNHLDFSERENLNKINKLYLKILRNLIKNKNTIILPTFNFKFFEKKLTSNDLSNITTGIHVKFLISKIKFTRTNKPIYNYAITGPNSKELLKLNQTTSFGSDSVIGFLSQNNGIGIGFGLQPENYGWVTIHSCEEYCKVPYRFYKTFKGRKKEKNQKVFEKVFVRKNRFKNTNNLKKVFNILKK